MMRTVCVFLLVSGVSWSTIADEAKTPTAVLLVARAGLPDTNFKDSVVLVMNNIFPAPAGLILNRPTRIEVSRLFPDLKPAHTEDKVYFGGPVDIASVLFLLRADAPPEHAIQVLDGVYLSTDRELLRKLLSRDRPMEGLRIFIGYAGWTPDQLELEIARGDWTLAPAETKDIFGRKSEHPWPEPQAPDDVHRAFQRHSTPACCPASPLSSRDSIMATANPAMRGERRAFCCCRDPTSAIGSVGG